MSLRPTHRRTLALSLTLMAAIAASSCGAGGGGGAGPDGAGQGLILSKFLQGGRANTPINQTLEFRFSEPVDPTSITVASMQVREGSAYGLTADGEFEVDGATVFFKPRIPGECGYGDAGFKPGTTYRVTVIGYPEAMAVRNSQGQFLTKTVTQEFSTSPESDPEFLADQIPGVLPSVDSTTPAHGTAAWTVDDTNEIVVEFSENLNPCTIMEGSSVRLSVYETGDKTNGFVPVEDAARDDPYTWGGNGTPISPAIRVPSTLVLDQTADYTTLRVRPTSGRFPENCLLVLELTPQIVDFGGSPLAPTTISFTTENLADAESTLAVLWDESTPIAESDTTADVDTARSPNRAQGWISYGGDGDNGPPPITLPGYPTLDAGGNEASCTERADGIMDDFFPTSDITLDTGATPFTCTNQSDGSMSAVFEFATFRIPDGVTVKIVGANPAIILVRGAAQIDPLGVLDVRGANGGNGATQCATGGTSGRGGPGGGDGGVGGYQSGSPSAWAGDGQSGYGASVAYAAPGDGGGFGGVNAYDPPGWGGSGVGGGGGGHVDIGEDGENLLSGTGQFSWAATPTKGEAGGFYPNDDQMRTPSCGSGGGGGGCDIYDPSWSTSACDSSMATGGGGGGGGGFVCITANGNITISGSILAQGGRGGGGGANTWTGGAGGGGGSGGGIRLLTPAKINLSNGTLNALGGNGGTGQNGTSTNTINLPHHDNDGGNGSHGRIVLEDGDGIIDGVGPTVTPNPADPAPSGYYQNALQGDRFLGGSSSTKATTQPISLGAIIDPANVVLQPLLTSDIEGMIPTGASLGFGTVCTVVEVQGYLADSTGDVIESSATGWYAVGYFDDSGIPNSPNWVSDRAPAGFPIDAGEGIAGLSGQTMFLQVRVSFEMPGATSPDDPGPAVDEIRFRYNADN